MFSGAPTQPAPTTPAPQIEKVDNNPTPQSKSKGPGKLANEMIKLSSYSAHLLLQSHLIHLNYECSNFFGVHKFTKTQYKEHQCQLDRIGELVRSLDFLMPMCCIGLMKAHSKFHHIESYNPEEMLLTYLKNLEEFGMAAKKVGKLAMKEDAPDVEHYCAQLVEENFTAAWQLKATLRNK